MEFNFFEGIKHKNDIVIFRYYIKNKKSCVFIIEIDLFRAVTLGLKKVVSVFVFSDRSMKIVDNFFVLKDTGLIMPPTVFIQPENSVFFWNDDLPV